MRIITILGFGLTILLAQANTSQAVEKAPVDSTFHKDLVTGLDYVAKSHFTEALALFDSLEQRFPHHPAPNFFKAATYQSWMLTYRVSTFQDQLYNNAQLAVTKGTKLMETDNDPWINFYLGAAYGYKALYLFRQHNWIRAYFDGSEGINNFNIALEKNPQLHDCYYGIGAYNYWRSAKSDVIRFLIFWMDDNRELGLKQLRFSIDNGRYCPYFASHGLIIAYFHNGNFKKALDLNDEVMQKISPPSLETLYMRGRIMAQFKKWTEVQSIYETILKAITSQPYISISYQVECKYWIALALKNLNKPDEALKLATQALAQSDKRVVDQELENPLEGFDTIKTWLEDLHQSLQ